MAELNNTIEQPTLALPQRKVLMMDVHLGTDMDKDFLTQFLSMGRVRKYINWNGITYMLNIQDDVKEKLKDLRTQRKSIQQKRYYKDNKANIYKNAIERYRSQLPNIIT